MKPGLAVGSEFVATTTVDQARTIAFMGDALRVHSTPSMTGDIESACRDLLVRYHDDGEDSVGARVEVDHLAPTLLGQAVVVRVRVVELALPRVAFEVEVHDELDLVGRSRHTRFVVDVARQAQRLAKKLERLEALRAG